MLERFLRKIIAEDFSFSNSDYTWVTIMACLFSSILITIFAVLLEIFFNILKMSFN